LNPGTFDAAIWISAPVSNQATGFPGCNEAASDIIRW